jgi:radical SAM protein with 4Fe4S-binding SPASM domain
MFNFQLVREALYALRTEGAGSVIRKTIRRLSPGDYRVRSKLDMVVVETTTYCNLKCAGCVRTVLNEGGKWENRHMTVEKFRRLVDELPPAGVLVPQGIGEPTMHPRMAEFIKIAGDSRKFDRIEINTNAMARPLEFYGQLFDAGLSELTVSVDSLTESVIDKVREGTEVPKLEQRLKEFSTLFPGRIGVRVTVGKWNYDGLPDLLNRLNDLGRFKIWIHPFFDMGSCEGILGQDKKKGLIDEVNKFRSRFPGLTIKVTQMEPLKDICISPWRHAVIRVDGKLMPCCNIMYEEMDLGNIFEESFGKVWRSARMERFRSDFLIKSPACCAHCPFYTFRNPGA